MNKHHLLSRRVFAGMCAAVIAFSATPAFAASKTESAESNDSEPAVSDIAADPELTISLNKTKVNAKTGKKFSLKAKTNLDGYKVTFRSTNKKIATVSSKGVVKTKKKGSAKIVAECSGAKAVCKVKVKVEEPAGNSITDSKMAAVASRVGCQTDYAYGESTVMCSAYSFAYANLQVTGSYRSAGSYWVGGAGCGWYGGTYSKYGSAKTMLAAIKKQIDSNKACVGMLRWGGADTHYVTFYGYTGKGDSLDDFKILDPWYGNLTKATGSYGYCWRGYHVVTID